MFWKRCLKEECCKKLLLVALVYTKTGLIFTFRYTFWRHFLPRSYKDWKATDLEWFFSEEMGILGIDGKLKADPKVNWKCSFIWKNKCFIFSQCVFVSERMEGVPQIKCELSGYEGWKRHLEPPYTRYSGTNSNVMIKMIPILVTWEEKSIWKAFVAQPT